jgi:hypothetical protein
MEERYYILSKEKLDYIIIQLDSLAKYNNCGSTSDIGKKLSNSILVDLSDSAIEEAVDLDSSKVRRYDDGFDRKKGYRAALKNLKNKLNGNN